MTLRLISVYGWMLDGILQAWITQTDEDGWLDEASGLFGLGTPTG